MNNEQRPFTIKCRKEEMKIALQWVEENFPTCRWTGGEYPTHFMPMSYSSCERYFVLYEIESGYEMYWSGEPNIMYDIHEFSELIASRFDLPSKDSWNFYYKEKTMDIKALLSIHPNDRIYIKCQNSNEIWDLLMDIAEQSSIIWKAGEKPLEYYGECTRTFMSHPSKIFNICLDFYGSDESKHRFLTCGYAAEKYYNDRISYWYGNQNIDLPSKQSLMDFLQE